MKYCSKHKKYRGRKKPKYECLECLNIYLKLNSKPRFPIKPSVPFKNKKKYSRNKTKGEE